jgi:hypothetical protein
LTATPRIAFVQQKGRGLNQHIMNKNTEPKKTIQRPTKSSRPTRSIEVDDGCWGSELSTATFALASRHHTANGLTASMTAQITM